MGPEFTPPAAEGTFVKISEFCAAHPQNVAPWLRNSLVHRARELRTAAAKARKAYRTDPYRTACELLARCYDAAAEVFEKALAEVDASRAKDHP